MLKAINSRVQRIAIAGSGFEAWLTAAALSSRLRAESTEITICDVDGSDAWDSLYAILPLTPSDAVRRIGISDAELARHCDSSFSLGSQFEGTQFDQACSTRPYGATGVDYAGALFHHYWLRNAPDKPISDYFSYSPGVRAMQSRAFAPPMERNAIGPLQHEYARHVDPTALTARLRTLALKAGVTQSVSKFGTVHRAENGTNIRHLETVSGERVEADLFIDCSGPARSILSGSDNVDWAAAPHSGGYSYTVEKRGNNETPPPWHTVDAGQDGWNIVVPCRSGQWQYRFDESGEPNFVPGNVSQPWDRNCLALGHAATAVLPIDPLQTLLLMDSIDRLITLLPGPDCLPGETVEYNQLFLRDVGEVHELNALHELARKYRGLGPDALAATDTTDSLRRRLALFGKRGWVARTDSYLIPRHTWSATCLFYGLRPQQYDLLAERIPAAALQENLAEMSDHIGRIVAEFPPLGAFLDAAGQSQ